MVKQLLNKLSKRCRNITLISLALTITACSSSLDSQTMKKNSPENIVTKHSNKYFYRLISAEKNGNLGSRKVLQIGRKMALESKEIVRGSCWDFIDTIYNRAGFPNKDRQYVLKGKYRKGPYAKVGDLKAGDWMYYINHGYKNVQHSGIFIGWIDKSKKRALVLSYPGQNKKKPGRYREYDLSHVYTIIRPKV